MKLWEVEHAYYGRLREGHTRFETFDDFLEEEGNTEFDYNLVYRWDWREGPFEEGEANLSGRPYAGDDYERNGVLEIFFVSQRHGTCRGVAIEVCRADEADVLAFLKPRWEFLRDMWAPL